MKVKLLTVRLRPELYQYFEEHAKDEGIPINRYVVKLLEMMQDGKEDEVVPYSREDLIKEVKQAEKDADAGLLPEFESGEKLIAYLNQ